jgi:hypothetical protein
MSQGVIILADRKPLETEVIADLNALFLMVEYVEIELRRIASGRVFSPSALRTVIANEIMERTANSEIRSVRN